MEYHSDPASHIRQTGRGTRRQIISRFLSMLTDIYRKLGFRLKLTDVSAATLGVNKPADGFRSLMWWKAAAGRMEVSVT